MCCSVPDLTSLAIHNKEDIKHPTLKTWRRMEKYPCSRTVMHSSFKRRSRSLYTKVNQDGITQKEVEILSLFCRNTLRHAPGEETANICKHHIPLKFLLTTSARVYKVRYWSCEQLQLFIFSSSLPPSSGHWKRFLKHCTPLKRVHLYNLNQIKEGQ